MIRDEPPDVRYRVAERHAARMLNALSEDMPGGPAQRLAAAIFQLLEFSYEVEIVLAGCRPEHGGIADGER